MFADEIRAAVMSAPRVKLPEVAAVLWRAYAAGHVSEAEAEELSALIETRKVVPAAPVAAVALRTAVGSRPKTGESLSVGAAGQPLGGFHRRSRCGSRPARSRCSQSWRLRPAGVGIAGSPSAISRRWRVCPRP